MPLPDPDAGARPPSLLSPLLPLSLPRKSLALSALLDNLCTVTDRNSEQPATPEPTGNGAETTSSSSTGATGGHLEGTNFSSENSGNSGASTAETPADNGGGADASGAGAGVDADASAAADAGAGAAPGADEPGQPDAPSAASEADAEPYDHDAVAAFEQPASPAYGQPDAHTPHESAAPSYPGAATPAYPGAGAPSYPGAATGAGADDGAGGAGAAGWSAPSQSGQPGQPGQTGQPGQYGHAEQSGQHTQAGQYGQPGQYGAQPGQPGQPGLGHYGYPVNPAAPGAASGGKKSGGPGKLIIIITIIVVGVLLLGAIIVGAFMLFRNVAGGGSVGSVGSADEAVEDFLTAIAEGDADTASGYLSSSGETYLMTDEILAASNERAPITDIEVGEPSGSGYSQTVNATFMVGDTEVKRKFEAYEIGGDWSIRNGAIRMYVNDLTDLGFNVNGTEIESSVVTLLPGSYEFTLDNEYFEFSGGDEFVIARDVDADKVSKALDAVLTEDALGTYRTLVADSLNECLEMTSLSTPCGMDLSDVDLNDYTVVEDSVTRKLDTESRKKLEKLTGESSYSTPTLVSTYEYFRVDITVKGKKGSETAEFNVYGGSRIGKPVVDFSQEPLTVEWE